MARTGQGFKAGVADTKNHVLDVRLVDRVVLDSSLPDGKAGAVPLVERGKLEPGGVGSSGSHGSEAPPVMAGRDGILPLRISASTSSCADLTARRADADSTLAKNAAPMTPISFCSKLTYTYLNVERTWPGSVSFLASRLSARQ